ncbi:MULTISPECIES: hypothetical protein [unclassified Vibrio]|uniref:hypothetical protein n=1 Tax=unclassified Vibrio TaxID=2614977 RepID=UPI0013618E17|nr:MULTISPECIES: hypothetical protein [unclassified Vibrio]NAW57762.1 hypothetical protein [Vibrio sp. V36_P2S2PM302]NAX28421.1 hypothetical protein [Vibrio sp. V38_P2S17PM301]NAX29575.1 hypothetical protein [Vibrio sp. V37_P2S8PM304]
MGGSSSSANHTNTNTETISGSVGVDGSNTGLIVSGAKGMTVNMTDGGAINAALKAMTDGTNTALKAGLEINKVSLATNADLSKAMGALNTDLSKYAIGQNTELTKTLGVHALVNADKATSDAMDIMKNLSLNSDAGTAQQTTKYFMVGATVIAVAVAVALGRR